MIVICAWCGEVEGGKPPYEDKRVTHGICTKCQTTYFPDILRRQREYQNERPLMTNFKDIPSPPMGS